MNNAEVSDILEIKDLLGRFARATDVGTVDEYVAALAEDIVMEVAGLPPRKGLAEARSGAEDMRAAGATGVDSHSLHLLGASEVSLDGDKASSITQFVYFRSADDVLTPAVGGRYFDEFVRTPEGWRISKRQMVRV